jgi:hypothetical protein
MNIYQRIIAVQKTCTYVKKDSEVGYGNNAYKAVSHDAVQEVVRQAMIDNEMVVMVSQQGKGEHYDGETKSGTANIRFEAVYDVSFICADKPEDRHTVSIEAHGEDFNDKGPGKAISYAVKTAFLKTFQLATGEDDEARLEERGSRSNTNTPPPATTSSTSKPAASGCISEAQGKRLFAICKGSGTTIADCANKFGFKKAGEIKKSQYKEVCEWAEVGHKAEMVQDVMNGDTPPHPDDDGIPF